MLLMRKICVLLSVGVFSIAAHAKQLDGLIGPSIYYLQHASVREKGGSVLYKFEFTRLSRHFGLDARLGTGQGYTDMGGSLRLFQHYAFNTNSNTGLILGGGLGAMFAELSQSPVYGKKNSQMDMVAHAFVRFLYDFERSVGLALDLEYQLVPYRSYSVGPPSNDRALRHRFGVAASLLFDPGI